jgi:hypothetical protein
MRRSETIRPEHLARPALVYVRQSTVDQVRHHLATIVTPCGRPASGCPGPSAQPNADAA